MAVDEKIMVILAVNRPLQAIRKNPSKKLAGIIKNSGE